MDTFFYKNNFMRTKISMQNLFLGKLILQQLYKVSEANIWSSQFELNVLDGDLVSFTGACPISGQSFGSPWISHHRCSGLMEEISSSTNKFEKTRNEKQEWEERCRNVMNTMANSTKQHKRITEQMEEDHEAYKALRDEQYVNYKASFTNKLNKQKQVSGPSCFLEQITRGLIKISNSNFSYKKSVKEWHEEMEFEDESRINIQYCRKKSSLFYFQLSTGVREQIVRNGDTVV